MSLVYENRYCLIQKSISFYAFAARVRRQKRWMLARMSSAVLVQRLHNCPICMPLHAGVSEHVSRPSTYVSLAVSCYPMLIGATA
jgi:hypothetical protein